MNKQDFMAALQKKLAGLPKEDREERLSFYSEMIDDRIDDGLTEEAAVAEIGPVDQVFRQIMEDIPLSRLVREKARPKRSLKAWEIVLLVLGSPLWASLLIAALAVVLSVFAALWAVILSCYAVVLALAACTVGGLAMSVVYFQQGNTAGAGCALAASLVCAGLAILLFFASTWVSKKVLCLIKSLVLKIKALFIKKEDENP